MIRYEENSLEAVRKLHPVWSPWGYLVDNSMHIEEQLALLANVDRDIVTEINIQIAMTINEFLLKAFFGVKKEDKEALYECLMNAVWHFPNFKQTEMCFETITSIDSLINEIVVLFGDSIYLELCVWLLEKELYH